jgi:hypothetical protein
MLQNLVKEFDAIRKFAQDEIECEPSRIKGRQTLCFALRSTNLTPKLQQLESWLLTTNAMLEQEKGGKKLVCAVHDSSPDFAACSPDLVTEKNKVKAMCDDFMAQIAKILG